MTIADVFGKFDFQTSMVIILLMTVGGLFFLLWRSSENQKNELRADLLATRAREAANNDKFIEALKAQNINTKIIAEALLPVKVSTDLIPGVAQDQRQTLSEVGHLMDLVRDRPTQPMRRRGDNQDG